MQLDTSFRSSFEVCSSKFLSELMKDYPEAKIKEWRNNNSTLHQRACIIDVEDLSQISQIVQRVFQHNQTTEGYPIVVVPVAGWDSKKTAKKHGFSCLSAEARNQRMVEEYAQSFSLSSWTTAKNADIILRISKKAQILEVFKNEEGYYLHVSAGVRITDADQYLLERGLALPPNMPTLHVASLVGASANGCYGPAGYYGPMTTNIVEMEVIDPMGTPLTLSATANPELFNVLRDCHMGSGFIVTDITLKNIEPKFMMKRHNILLKDAEAFKIAMHEKNRVEEEHFVAMYIPVDIHAKGDHDSRIRVTTIGRTSEVPTHATQTREHKELTDYLNLMETETGEPLIDLIVRTPELRQFFPFVLKAATSKTYGKEKETTEIDWSASILHIFRTYTDLPLCDINWLIQVESPEDARNLLVALIELTEHRLKELASHNEYPLFNAFSRYLKGIYYPEGEGGVAATATDKASQSILSFELLTYSALEGTPSFKSLVIDVVNLLTERGYKFKYHPGKTWPEHVSTLSQLFNDTIGAKRLENFQAAITHLHDGNTEASPFLTPQKRAFIGLTPPQAFEMERFETLSRSEFLGMKNLKEESGQPAIQAISKKQGKAALKTIIALAKEHGNQDVRRQAREMLGRK